MESYDHYHNRKYMNRERLLAYIDQIRIIKKYTEPEYSILEIGPGNYYLNYILKNIFNQSVVTLDHLPELRPDICTDIIDPDFELDKVFDVGLCFQVIEHIEWQFLKTAIKNLRKYIKKFLLISTPDTNYFIQFHLNTLYLKFKPLAYTITLPRIGMNKNVFGSDHKWEIGIHNGNKIIKTKDIINEIFGRENVVDDYRGREFPGHHFFVLKGSAR